MFVSAKKPIKMKQIIKNYFLHDRGYAAGVSLVIQFSKRLSLKKQLNNHPESDYLLGVIHQELLDIGGFSKDEKRTILLTPVKPVEQKQADLPVMEDEQDVPDAGVDAASPVTGESTALPTGEANTKAETKPKATAKKARREK
jgi:hypothetical protein